MYRNWGREKREETCTAKFEEGGELEDGREGIEGCYEGWRCAKRVRVTRFETCGWRLKS